MLIGYARTSTLDQAAGFDAQIRDLEAAGAERIYREQVSAVGERAQMETALDHLRPGDTLVVTRLDRLARSTAHLLQIVDRIEAAGAALKILNLGVDTSTATGRLVLTTIGAIAEFERALLLERQREGIARAKAEGKYKGRKPTARAKADQVRQLRDQGIAAAEIARRLGIGRASVYRCLEAPSMRPCGCSATGSALAAGRRSLIQPQVNSTCLYQVRVVERLCLRQSVAPIIHPRGWASRNPL